MSWGMVDEMETYRFEEETEVQLNPAVLRKIPDLNAKQLEKIDQFEQKQNRV